MALPKFTQLPRDTRDTLFVLAVITWVAAPLIGQVPWWCIAMGGLVILWRAWLAVGNRPLPPTLWRFGLLALAVLGTLLSYRTLLGRDAGVTLLMVLLALKTLELRARRDAFVVFFLSFFLMLTQFFYSQSLVTALAMLLALWGLLTALVNAHMPVGRPPLWQAARLAGGMTLLGAPIMLVLFMLFPRMAPLWGLPGDAMAGRSGLSGSMSVGNIASLALDDSVAMRLRFDGSMPQSAELYFRGPVLNEFDGRRWTVTPWFEQLAKVAPPQLTVQGDPVNYQITLEPNQQPWLLTLDATPNAPTVARLTPRQTPDGQWVLSRPVTELLRYQVQSFTRYQSDLDLQPSQLKRSLVLPPNFNLRTRLWAQELAQNHPDPAQRVQAVLAHLRSGGYQYTLEPGVYGRDSADEFWFDRKLGFCEHIAAAFVIVMRASNIPARVVTGYQGAERNPLDGFWTVRQSDAHAWAEVWLNGQGWVRVDPTGAVSPGRIGAFQRLATPRGAVATALLGTVSPEVAITLRAAWDAVNNRWNQWVLNYTQSRQLDLLKSLGFDAPSWEDLIYVLCGLVVSVSLAGALWSAWERQHQDPWHKLLARARQALVQAGITVPAQSSPRQLMQALQNQSDARLQRPDLQRWLMQLEALRYAPPAGDSQHAEARRPNAKSPSSGADAKRRVATLQRDLTRLLPLRTP
jgi:transglutaminase-like putative cysteine protease